MRFCEIKMLTTFVNSGDDSNCLGAANEKKNYKYIQVNIKCPTFRRKKYNDNFQRLHTLLAETFVIS